MVHVHHMYLVDEEHVVTTCVPAITLRALLPSFLDGVVAIRSSSSHSRTVSASGLAFFFLSLPSFSLPFCAASASSRSRFRLAAGFASAGSVLGGSAAFSALSPLSPSAGAGFSLLRLCFSSARGASTCLSTLS